MKLIILLFLSMLTLTEESFAQSPFDTTTYGRNPAAGKYASIRGINMYYEIYGKGEPLLIIHGNGSSISSFLFQIPYFAKKYMVIVADSRSQGKSIDHSDTLSYQMMAEDLNTLLDKLQLKSCYVIGWSDGGINGLLLAIKHPDKVKKLAITGANLWPDTSAVAPFAYQSILNDIITLRDSISKMKIQPDEIKNRLKLLNLEKNEPHITLQQLKKIICPTLVIGGDHDVILPAHTSLIAQTIPNSYLWILPNSGHSIPVFHRDIFNEVVNDFFEKPYRKIQGAARYY